MEVFQPNLYQEEESNLVVWDRSTTLMHFYEKDNSDNFIFEDNYRYQFK